jgi:transposase-like protein
MVAVFLLAPNARAEDTRLEMWEEPSHQLVFVDGPVRVLDVRIAPGATSEYHKHRFATAYVIIQDALVANQYWDDQWSASGPRELREAGVLVDHANYVDKPYYHRVRNDDQKTFHVVAVINERSLADESGTADRSEANAIIDNAWFREHRIKVAPGANSEKLTFENDSVLVQFDEGPSHIVEHGVTHSFKTAPATFSWHPKGTEFRIGNSSQQTLELVVIELKE